MRVCCQCENWASGGIESFLSNVLMRLDMTRLEVDIVATQLCDSIFTESLKEHGVRFYELSGDQHRVMENHRRFRAILRDRRYDVLHLNAFHGLSLAYLRIAREEGVPTRIAHSHNTALRKTMTKPIKLIIHYWSRGRYTRDATDLCACSKSAAAFLFSAKELDRRGYKYIPNGVDAKRFRFDPVVRERMRHELALDGKFVIGHVGRMCFQKNQSFLLDVLAEAVKARPESMLLLVGEGEDKPMLKERARRLNITDKVLFYGACERVERLYWAMDVFAFPSLFEGLGIAAVEAQAAGIPVVCSEYVPEETHITQSISSISLSAGTAVWADALLAAPGPTPDGADAVREAGFDVTDAAALLASRYLRTEDYGESHDLGHNCDV